MPEPDAPPHSTPLVPIARALRDAVERLAFDGDVAHVYNPLRYAWRPHRAYLERFGWGRKEVLLIGMNPGPFGMAQTGVPFGEVAAVRTWMGIHERVGRPPDEHPRRAVEGFACARSEVSGRRLWSWARDRFGTPEAFFARFFVHNYCPLAFLAASGRNLTPDRLPRTERDALFEPCDRALAAVAAALDPALVVGIGTFAEHRARAALPAGGPRIGRVLHPSPASPAANRGWARAMDRELQALGVALP